MSDGKPMRRSERRAREHARGKTIPKWLAWLIMALFVFLTGVLLWFGLAIVVQCERATDGSVNVTVHRKLLNWIPITSEAIPDVASAKAAFSKSTTKSGGSTRSQTSEQLVLTAKDGSEWHSPLCTPSLGTRPKAMAEQINTFIANTAPSAAPSAAPTLTTWWMPWLVNLGAIPFILVSLVSFCALGEVILRLFCYFKDDPPANRENQP